ncbi:MAG: monomethylamine:corrinoid methyltransferase [Treponema sp.]|nr:monomethylamine:corrinoid methyltransferase [Treponema sp.]
MARCCYAPGWELLVNTGVYNISTGRAIKLNPGEIDCAAKYQKQTLVIGKGKDRFTLRDRKAEDPRKPGASWGNPGCPAPDPLAPQFACKYRPICL